MAIQNALDKKNSCEIFGPIPAIMEKRKKKFHARLLFQHTDRIVLQAVNSQIITFLANNKIPSSISWSVDVDPKEIF